MNRGRIGNSQENSGAIDSILATEEPLVPSSGFLASVMDRIHNEARIPAPLPFPWKRAVPGIVLAVGVFGWGAVGFLKQAVPAARAFSFTQLPFAISASRPVEVTGWVFFALIVSLISWILSRRLAGQSGLL
jgi:hypothetical protein